MQKKMNLYGKEIRKYFRKLNFNFFLSINMFLKKIPILDPSSNGKFVWDFLIFFAILMLTFLIPFCTVFDGYKN
jgi:hypothetical protein